MEPSKRERMLTVELGKLPPQALDLEEAVLAAILLDTRAIQQIAGKLNVNSFYKDAHQKIYFACLELWNMNDPIDILTVTLAFPN